MPRIAEIICKLNLPAAISQIIQLFLDIQLRDCRTLFCDK